MPSAPSISPPPLPGPGCQPSPEALWRQLFAEAESPQLICHGLEVTEMNRRAQALLGAASASHCPGLADFLTVGTVEQCSRLLVPERIEPETLNAVSILPYGEFAQVADLRFAPLGDGWFLVSIEDCSRRLRMESHAQRLNTAINATPESVFLTDARFRLSFVNTAFQAATGLTLEDALGESIESFRANSEREKIAECRQQVIEGHDWVGEFLNQRRDGSLYPVAASISPVYDSKGRFLGCVGFERDITAKKQLQAELLIERNLVGSILNSLDSAVFTLDREFRLTHVNQTGSELCAKHRGLAMGSPPQVGQSFLDAVGHATKRAELQRLFQYVLASGQPFEMHDTAGDDQQWLVNIVPWRHDGKIHGLIYRVTDHSRLHQLENQLFQAQKMETVGALAAGVAHDFNNLLMAIHGNASLLLMDDKLGAEVRQRLERIDQAASRAAGITRQLLTFSRASEEQVTVADFNQVLQEAGELARRVVRRQVDLALREAPVPVRVRIDATRAQQLLLNLCVNAQDAMPSGGHLVIENAMAALTPAQAARIKRAIGDSFVRCSVSDTGTGIPPEVLPRIFDPFFTTKEKGKGTGLGLAIVHSVVAEAGGFIEVDSQVGRGTTFHIYLPETRATPSAEAPAADQQVKRGSGRILLVDDQDLVLDFSQKFLRSAGYEVLTASSGEAALKVLEGLDQPVNLVLTDYSMPGMNGRQLISRIAERWPSVRFVLATGFLEDDERDQILAAHGTQILNKPFNLAEAARLVSNLIHKDGQIPGAV